MKTCRICNSRKLRTFLSLGDMPLPNGFLLEDELKKTEAKYDLSVSICKSCSLVQLNTVVPPELMFTNYLYIPSTSSTMLSHFEKMADDLIEKLRLTHDDLVLDIGCNDGTFLNFFHKRSLPALGVDPAKNLIPPVQKKNINIISDFFSKVLAETLILQGYKPKLITATNVLAHIDDLHDFCSGVHTLLRGSGVFVAEFPYLVDLLEKTQFDTIYHEHLSYFSLTPLVRLFEMHDMEIFDLSRIPIHGGSIRIFVGKTGDHVVMPSVGACLREEENLELNVDHIYDEFTARVKFNAHSLTQCLKDLKRLGNRIVGYGAPAKSSVLLNYSGISNELIEYIVDSIPCKQGRYTPGTRIPIHSEEKLNFDNPDYLVIFAWNFKDEILKKQASFCKRGGRFIVPSPSVMMLP